MAGSIKGYRVAVHDVSQIQVIELLLLEMAVLDMHVLIEG